ncbi:MAG TPA: hypothetical protein VG248_04985 [Caulobacteraceae bacterium]|jgi:hypothetical protein|nr:hypothetical protein [Caulobacteraceae bacterium]
MERPTAPAKRFVPAPAIVDDATAQAAPTQIMLGLDFGTAYTKAVWGDLGGSATGVAAVGQGREPIGESVVWIDQGGGLHLTDPGGARAERFLKMRLAGRGLGGGSAEDVEAMSTFFVGSMLRLAHAATSQALRGRVFGLAGAAIGCPAEYCDEWRLDVFRRVAAQGWRWAHDVAAPTTLQAMRTWMRTPPDDAARTLCEARAEVAAAMDAFALRRDTQEGRYAFLDIGAGTLDGACFKIFREHGLARITVLSAAVVDLGVEKVAEMVAGAPDEIAARKQDLFDRKSLDGGRWGTVREAISGFIGQLLVGARKSDGHSDWLAAEHGQRGIWSLDIHKAEVARRLPVFFGGGGMKSRFYRDATTWADNSNLTSQYGLPRLSLNDIPTPEGFVASRGVEFHRFAVAYGLTRPAHLAPTLVLPRQISRLVAPETPARRRPPRAPDYGDSKDIFG